MRSKTAKRPNYDPEDKNQRVPVTDWLAMMGKTKHLLKPENSECLKEVEADIERRWSRLKAMHENPML